LAQAIFGSNKAGSLWSSIGINDHSEAGQLYVSVYSSSTDGP